MWLDEALGEYVITDDGELIQGDLAIDMYGTVYEYDYETDALSVIGGVACNAEGMPLEFDEKSQLCVNELVAVHDK